ncbi:MAG: hypothetical protein H0W76_08665 [Pyrinomonadaceae bacterium]|nr:hypothetical protein [Pyrinomonadaceae bacterium]
MIDVPQDVISKPKDVTEVVSPERFNDVTRCVVGMPLSYAWRGYGSAVFFEFGELKPDGKHLKGEATAMLEWSWRVEKRKSVFFGSFSGDRRITNQLQSLVGREVVDITVDGRLPELVITLSSGVWIHSFTTVEGHPEWTLFLPDGSCLSSRLGRVELEACNKNPKG